MAHLGKIKKIIGSKLFLFAAVFALIGLALSVGRESYRKHQLTKEINKLESSIERLEGRNRQLSNLMDYFSEESFLEKEARIKLNLQKPGEKVVIFSDKKKAKEEVRLDNEEAEETANYWKWWEYFFKRD